MARLRVLAVTLVITLAMLASAARGQLNPLRDFELTAGDIELLTTTADRLYEASQIGVAETWSNPDSGNSGTVEILELFEREGLPCRRVEHVVKIDRDPVPKRLMLASCRVPDGRWLLVWARAHGETGGSACGSPHLWPAVARVRLPVAENLLEAVGACLRQRSRRLLLAVALHLAPHAPPRVDINLPKRAFQSAPMAGESLRTIWSLKPSISSAQCRRCSPVRPELLPPQAGRRRQLRRGE